MNAHEDYMRRKEENECVVEGCEKQHMCSHCHKCQEHHDMEEDVR